MARAPYPITSCLAAAAAALALVVAGCSEKKDGTPAAGQLPALYTIPGLDSALSSAGGRMLVMDFYADWCKPCRALAPAIGELASEFKGKADFYRVNIDKSPQLAREFGIRGIPLVVFMKNDSAVYALTGLNPKASYARILTLCGDTVSAAECMKLLRAE